MFCCFSIWKYFLALLLLGNFNFGDCHFENVFLALYSAFKIFFGIWQLENDLCYRYQNQSFPILESEISYKNNLIQIKNRRRIRDLNLPRNVSYHETRRLILIKIIKQVIVVFQEIY